MQIVNLGIHEYVLLISLIDGIIFWRICYVYLFAISYVDTSILGISMIYANNKLRIYEYVLLIFLICWNYIIFEHLLLISLLLLSILIRDVVYVCIAVS